MLSTIFQLVVAGHDTTTSLIGNGTVALLRHPEQRDALVADPALVPRAIEEMPALGRARPALDVPLHDRGRPARRRRHPRLRAGDHLAGRGQPRPRTATANAEAFDITRADGSHLAFGHGIHHCLGARLARLEGLIAFTALLTRFPAMRLAVPPRPSCAGATATASCCAGSPSCPSSSDRRARR